MIANFPPPGELCAHGARRLNMLPETLGGLIEPRAGAIDVGADGQRQARIHNRQAAFFKLALDRVLRQPTHPVAVEDHAF